jgi:hypothetical protein
LERNIWGVGTPVFHRLASFSRSSHCSSGNASPFAVNAKYGSRAIEQYCVHAAGTSHASRAGCLRGVVGSGLNGDTCVAQGNPSSKPGSQSFSSAEVFLPHPSQQVERHSESTDSWHVPPRSRRYAPLSGAAKYPAGASPSKCIIIIRWGKRVKAHPVVLITSLLQP